MDWTQSYIKGAINSNIQPIIIAREVKNKFKSKKSHLPTKAWLDREDTMRQAKDFNKLNKSKIIKIFEYNFKGDKLNFNEIKY